MGVVLARPRLSQSQDSRPSHAAAPTPHAATITGPRSPHKSRVWSCFSHCCRPPAQSRWYGEGGRMGSAGPNSKLVGPVPASRQSRQRATGLLAFEFAPWAPSGWTVPNVGVRFFCVGAVHPPRMPPSLPPPPSVQTVRPSITHSQRLTSDEICQHCVARRSPVRNSHLALQK